MSWTKKTENGMLVAHETISLTSGSTADSNTTYIDFLLPDVDFVILVDPTVGNASLSASAAVDVKVSFDQTTTYSVLKSDLITGAKASQKAGFYDISANGQAPYYQVTVNPNDVEASGDQVKVIVMQSQARG